MIDVVTCLNLVYMNEQQNYTMMKTDLLRSVIKYNIYHSHWEVSNCDKQSFDSHTHIFFLKTRQSSPHKQTI